MIFDGSLPLPAHIADAIPDDLAVTVYQLSPSKGGVVIGMCVDLFDHIEIVDRIAGVADQEMEIYAVGVAILGFRIGYAQHCLEQGHLLSDDDLVAALAAATVRDDIDIADLIAVAVERGIGKVDPAPAPIVGGLRH